MEASEVENWTLRDLGMALEGCSLAAEEAVRCGVRGRELLGEGKVAMMGGKEVEHGWRAWVLVRVIGLACLTCRWVDYRRDCWPRISRTRVSDAVLSIHYLIPILGKLVRILRLLFSLDIRDTRRK